MEVDNVNHPPHYTSHPSGVECIELTRWMPFNLGNAFKYVFRAEHKGDIVENYRKAIWYLKDEISRITIEDFKLETIDIYTSSYAQNYMLNLGRVCGAETSQVRASILRVIGFAAFSDRDTTTTVSEEQLQRAAEELDILINKEGEKDETSKK
jgi:hypothetical protein